MNTTVLFEILNLLGILALAVITIAFLIFLRDKLKHLLEVTFNKLKCLNKKQQRKQS